MSRYRLIEAFEKETVLPIDLNKVTKWLIQQHIQNEIDFVPAELDPKDVIRGFVHRYKAHRGGWSIEPVLVSDIYYDTRQPIEWQNMTCAKELLHILDGACVGDAAKFDQLTQRLALPDDVQHLLADPDFAFVDKGHRSRLRVTLTPCGTRSSIASLQEETGDCCGDSAPSCNARGTRENSYVRPVAGSVRDHQG